MWLWYRPDPLRPPEIVVVAIVVAIVATTTTTTTAVRHRSSRSSSSSSSRRCHRQFFVMLYRIGSMALIMFSLTPLGSLYVLSFVAMGGGSGGGDDRSTNRNRTSHGTGITRTTTGGITPCKEKKRLTQSLVPTYHDKLCHSSSSPSSTTTTTTTKPTITTITTTTTTTTTGQPQPSQVSFGNDASAPVLLDTRGIWMALLLRTTTSPQSMMIMTQEKQSQQQQLGSLLRKKTCRVQSQIGPIYLTHLCQKIPK